MKWFLYTRGSIPPYRLEIAFRGVQKFGTRYNGTRADWVLYTTLGHNLTWGWDKAQLFAVGKNIIRTCSTRAGQTKHFRSIETLINRANQASEAVRSMDVRRLDANEFIQLHRRLFCETGPAHGFLDIDIDAVDAVFEGHLHRIIRRELPKAMVQEQTAALLKKLSVPVHQTYVAEEEIAMNRAISRGVSARDIHRLFEKYWWTPLGWEQHQLVSEQDYAKKIAQARKHRMSRTKLIRLSEFPARIAKQRQQLIRRYRLSPVVKHWLGVLDQYAFYHDRRKEMQCRSIYAFHLWLREAAWRLRVPARDLEWLLSHEIFRLLQGRKFNKTEIARRKRACFVLAAKSRIVVKSGSQALAARGRVLGSDAGVARELKGIGVTNGIIRARARVCNGVAEARRKMKRGDILVCGMTLPDYVSVMKLASAIVTDEGGITCHAAIVARELHKPCVVGTKIATKVLKDGDRVEVDATNGIVRKL